MASRRKIFTPDSSPAKAGSSLAEAEALFKMIPEQVPNRGLEAFSKRMGVARSALDQGSKESRLAGRARHATRLMQQCETTLKGIAASSEETELLRELSAFLDYIEFGDRS